MEKALLYITVLLFYIGCNRDSAQRNIGNNSGVLVDQNESIVAAIEKAGVTDSIMSILSSQIDSSQYSLSNWLNPPIQFLDFNNDNDNEFAVSIENRMTHEKGIAIFTPKASITIIGSGIPFGTGGKDFGWVDSWRPALLETVQQTVYTQDGDIDTSRTDEVELNGEVLVLMVSEGPTVYVAWLSDSIQWILQDG